MPEIAKYRSRYIRSLDGWGIGDVTFKPYLISAERSTVIGSDLIESARGYIGARFPAICEEEGHHHGLGYVILHAGEMRNWLLIHWWAYGDIVLRMIASSPTDSSDFSSQDARRFHACVWEHVVIDYERNAWVGHMMKEKSDRSGYLGDRLSDGAY